MADRYSDTTTGRGDAITKNFAFMSLEEEAQDTGETTVGFTRITMPTGGKNPPMPAQSVGMRGEPGFDDDPCYGPGTAGGGNGGGA